MKFLVILCLLAFAAADEDKTQDKKTQPFDSVQNTSSLTQPSLLNGQVFPSSFSNVFSTNDPVSNLAFTGFSGNVSPIQPINPDFFVSPAAGLPVNSGVQVNNALPVNNAAQINNPVPVNNAIPVNSGIPVNTGIPVNSAIPVNGAFPAFPVTRTVLPGSNAVVGGVQPSFPVAGNVFPAVTTIPSQFPAVATIPQFPAVLPGVPTTVIDPNAAAGGVISPVAAPAFRFSDPLPITPQGLQPVQQVGLAAIPAFTSGILPSLTNGVLQGQLQGQNLQQILKNPTANPTGIPTGIPNGISNPQGLTSGNIPSGPLTFRNS